MEKIKKYPLYQRGNPQLRIFLPNFWLKLVEPVRKQPKNIVQFHCSMEMTRYDIKNYLEKIYNVKTMNIRTRIQTGEIHRRPGYVVKEDDIKVAYAVLPKGEVFTFPDVFETEDTKKGRAEEMEQFEEMKQGQQEYIQANRSRPGLPGWYSI